MTVPDPDVLDAVAALLPPVAAGLAAVLAPVVAAAGPDVWQGVAATAFGTDLDAWDRVLATVEAGLQAWSCELAMQAARLRAGG